VNPDFIKSNYLTTCSDKNVKKTVIKIYDGKQMVIHHRSSSMRAYLPLFQNDLPQIFIIVIMLLNNLT
jgi:hypothetical protein